MKTRLSLKTLLLGALTVGLSSVSHATTAYWQGTSQVAIGATSGTGAVPVGSGGTGQVYMTNQTSVTSGTSLALSASGVTAAGTLPSGDATGYFLWSTNSTVPGTGTWNTITPTIAQVNSGGGTSVTLTPAALTITGNNASKVYGTTDPTLSDTISGLVNGDTSSVITGLSVTTTATTGSATGSYNVTPTGATDSNYNITENSGTLNVTQAPLTGTANNATVTYTGSAYSGGNGITYTGFVNGDNASVVTGTPSYAGTSQGAIHPGGYTIIPSGTSATNYSITFANGTLTINQATPTVIWSTPAAITYPTALSATQLNPSSVAGTYAYVDTSNGNAVVSSGTVLTAGTHVLQTILTPTDSTDYTSASTTVSLVVNKATPTISWSTPNAITYPTALSAPQLNATSGGVAGSFVYTPASGTVLNAGSGQTLSVAFTPTDTTDYNNASGSTTITVNAGTPTVTVAGISNQTYNPSSYLLSVSASVSFTPTVTAGTMTFALHNPGGTTIATSSAASVTSGSASTTITVPAGTIVGTGYYVVGSYAGATNWANATSPTA
jgi:hypothetical protein